MPQKKGRFVRKNYLIRKTFQIKFSLLIFITTFVIGLIALWTTYTTTWDEITQQVKSQQFYEKIRAADTAKSQREKADLVNSIIIVEFSEVFERISAILVLRILVGSFLLFILSIFASHKIAGPLHRIEKAILSVDNGDLNIDLSRLRAGDEMAELAQMINSAIGKIREAMNKCRKKAKKLSDLSAQLAAQNISKEQAEKAKQEMQTIAGQIVTEMEAFNVPKGKHVKA